MAYNWRTYSIPLAAGLDTESDQRALEAPKLAVARDLQFDEKGGIQTRKPFASLGVNILGGGTLSNIRRIVASGDELLCFTKDTLYSWSVRDTAWVSKGTHLAVKMAEQPAFVRTSEQTQCDRAELSGVVVYAWLDTAAAAGIYVAAIDSDTGAVLLAPTAVGAATATRPRLVATTNKIMLFYVDGSDLLGVAIDPANLASSVVATATTLFQCNAYYDVVGYGATVVVGCRRTVTTSYTVAKVAEALTATIVSPARTCDGPIAVSVSPDGVSVQVIRANGTNIQGDLVTFSALADTYTAQAVGTAAGTPVNQIAACHRSTTDSSVYRCYAFWSSQEATDATSWEAKYNWVSTGNTLGTQARLSYRLGIASRAFDRDGRIYVWTAFAGVSSFSGAGEPGFRAQLQNTYFLYRDDEFLVAKAAMFRAGGHASVTGHLPGVQSLGSGVYAWCGTERRIISVGANQSSYGARAPRDIKLTFDSDEARRVAKLGETLYVTGGELLQYDGNGLYEVGFHVYPYYFGAIESAGAGAVAAGTYALKNTIRWDNAKGERERSTTATVGTVEITVGNTVQITSWLPIAVTHKTGTGSRPAQEVWRTTVNPTIDTPFYLVTSVDPAATGDNGYVENDHDLTSFSTWNDEYADSTASTKETNPENGGILENLAPPAASIVASTHDRLFLAGVPGDLDRVWYSKLRSEGEIAAFHDALTIDVPPAGGAITSVAFLDETLIVFRESAIYALPGDGFDNAGGGQNYGPARRMSADIGAVSHESVAFTPAGLVFKSLKGWQLLTRGGEVQYIGGPVASFDSDTVVAVHVVEAQHQIRCVTTSRMLVFDYLAQQWAEWTIASSVGSTLWQGTHTLATASATSTEQTTYTSLTYGLDVETGWIKLADLQGFGSVRWAMILGEYRTAHSVRIRIAYNYAETDSAGPTWVDDKLFTPSGSAGSPLQFRHGPKRHKCESIKIRITATLSGVSGSPPTGEALKLTGLALEVGIEPGLYRRLPAAQKQ